jgi:hypothetical protein
VHELVLNKVKVVNSATDSDFDICTVCFFVEYIPLWYIISQIGICTAMNHNKVLSVSSVHAACFGRADSPQAFKSTLTLSTYIFQTCEISQILQSITVNLYVTLAHALESRPGCL